MIKFRFDEEIRQKLMDIDWPEWEDDRLKMAVSYFYDPKEFIRAYEEGLI